MPGRIVLGLGGTVDYELRWDLEAFQRLVDRHSIGRGELDGPTASTVLDERGIVVAVLRSMQRGRGEEYFVEDKEALLAFGGHFAHEVALGGTCVRAALAIDNLGRPSTVHLVSISDEVRRLLPPSVRWVCSAQQDSLDPHVIVQYPRGVSVRVADGAVTASRPNRVILVNDAPNEHLLLSPELPRVLASARVVLISGFNAMKSVPELRLRMGELASALRSAPSEALVVYEDAGFHDDAMREVVMEYVPGLADVHSLNEDEAQHHLGRTVDLACPQAVAEMMAQLHGLVGAPTVLVHTSRYAAVIGTRTRLLRDAAVRGCLLASTRFLHGDHYGAEEHAAVARAEREEIGVRLRDEPRLRAAGVLIAPGFAVRSENPTTIGLGDAFIGGVVAHLAERMGEADGEHR